MILFVILCAVLTGCRAQSGQAASSAEYAVTYSAAGTAASYQDDLNETAGETAAEYDHNNAGSEQTENIADGSSKKDGAASESTTKTAEQDKTTAKSKGSDHADKTTEKGDKTTTRLTTSSAVKKETAAGESNASETAAQASTAADRQTSTTTKNNQTTAKSQSGSAASKVTTRSTTASNTKTTSPETAKTTAHSSTITTSSSARISCTVTIECGVILDNMDKLKKGHEKYVPENGIILDTYSVTVSAGSSAYDALEKACGDNGVKLTASRSVYGIYVSGINNLDEKDCGKSSGWVYGVNGVNPNKSCGKYKLADGDTVVFSYTCS